MSAFQIPVDQISTLVPNWNSDTFLNQAFTEQRNRYNIHHLVDYGGVGIFPSRSSINGEPTDYPNVHLKNNRMNSCDFKPKRFSMPLKVNRKFRSQEADERNGREKQRGSFKTIVPNSNLFVVDNLWGMLISVNPDCYAITIERIEDKGRDEIPSAFYIDPYSRIEYVKFDKRNGLIQQVIPDIVQLNGKRLLLIRQETALVILRLLPIGQHEKFPMPEEESIIRFGVEQPTSELDDSDSSNQPTIKTLLKKGSLRYISTNEILPSQLLFGLNLHSSDMTMSLVEYSLTKECTSWSTKQDDWNIPRVGLNFNYPVSLYHTLCSPKLSIYAETKEVALLDTRCKPDDCFRSIASLSAMKNLNEFERFRMACSLCINRYQHLVLSDHHLCLFDIRYPNSSLLQWKHMLETDDVNRLRHLSTSHNIRNETDKFKSCTVSMANNDQICLMSLKLNQPPIIQPAGLHPPLHISQPSDCYYYASLANGDIERRLSTPELQGVQIVQSSVGFSIFQMTNQHDIFVQDFHDKINSEHELEDSSFKYPFNSKYSGVDEKSITYLKAIFKHLPVDDGYASNFDDECICCKKRWIKHVVETDQTTMEESGEDMDSPSSPRITLRNKKKVGLPANSLINLKKRLADYNKEIQIQLGFKDICHESIFKENVTKLTDKYNQIKLENESSELRIAEKMLENDDGEDVVNKPANDWNLYTQNLLDKWTVADFQI